MSKFTIKVELQGLKIEVEGTKEDAPRLAQKIGQQLGGLLQPAGLLGPGNGQPSGASPDSVEVDGNASAKGLRRKRKGAPGGATRTAADDINLSIDPTKYGSPTQTWTTAQKAIWFLHVVGQTTDTKHLTGYAIAKNFNKHFRSAGAIVGGNVSKGLEKERLKGTDATVGTDQSGGTAQYFLTQAGNAMAEQLIRGDAAAATAA